jgi:DeoR family fructose operon transcriptional repressor
MKSPERNLRLRELFSHQEFLSAEELCRHLGVSDSTVRRDLIELEQQKVLRRVHGGALSLTTRDEAVDFRKLSTSNTVEKDRIGIAAAQRIQDGQTVILAGGSTTLAVARHLLNRPIQVITNSLSIAQVFFDSKQVEVILTGGYLYPRTGVLLGPLCEEFLARVTADVLVIGIGGISERGLSDSNTLIVGVVRKMISAAREVMVVADHGKFGKDSMVHLAPLSTVHHLVSDTSLAGDMRTLLDSSGVKYQLA